MASAISLYEDLINAADERTRMRLIAEALDRLEHRSVPDGVATSQQVADAEARSTANLRETELRLQKEIEQVRADLRTEIEQVRADLRTEIEHVRADLQTQIAQAKADMLKWGAGLFVLQGTAIVGALAAILGG